jgi:hypothetical protein
MKRQGFDLAAFCLELSTSRLLDTTVSPPYSPYSALANFAGAIVEK